MNTSPPHARARVSGPATRIFLAILGLALAAALSPSAYASASASPTGASHSLPGSHGVTVASTSDAEQLRHDVAIPFNPQLFGVHDAHLSSLSRPSTGSIRLWDSGTTWPEMQSLPHQYDFSRLDSLVEAAYRNGTEVTFVFAMTPQFAAPDPSSPAYQSEMPSLSAYRQFVTAVMSRYRDFFGPGVRGITNYQVWNEANIDTFWTGTPAQMAELTRTVWRVHNRIDPGARVIAPAFESRMAYQRTWLRRFYAERVGGRPVWHYIDAVSLNLYPLDSYEGRPGTPEDSMALLAKSRELLAADGVPSTIPVWNTEVNYGLRPGNPGGTPAVPVPYVVQAAYVMRTYLLNQARDVGRVFWYAYDMGDLPVDRGGLPLANTLLTTPSDRTTLTPAGQAFARVRTWMDGTMVGAPGQAACPVDAHGTYTCTIQYRSGTVGRIYWNPFSTAHVRLARSARSRTDELGNVTEIAGLRRMAVRYKPVLVRSAR